MSSLPTPKQVYLLSLVYEKSVEPVLSLVPRIWALALPCLSKRATLKAPRRCILSHHDMGHFCQKPMRAYNTPRRASPLLCFWQTVELARFRYVKTKAYSYAFYVCTSTHSFSPCGTFSKGKVIAKLKKIFQTTTIYNKIMLKISFFTKSKYFEP